ncbi:lysozyme [uncultured Caudovirales phage]|uniref:Lysozyme n=1 Tax=uncultured Caudovirales phage TaxID=2100421 RepID=A0A6J5M648_9CAUD|nr:lysozyme [uncultured Caudovirales phage]
MRTIDTIVIHCAATSPSMDIGAAEIDRWHRARGWFGCGYHFVIRRNGVLESASTSRCRPLFQAGAHVGDCGPGWNARSIGICLAGGVSEADPPGFSANTSKPEDNFTEAQRSTLIRLLRTLRDQFPFSRILGHRDLIKETKAPPKACPSFDVAAFLKQANF